MALVKSFEPVIGTNPTVLILGSMPGIASLEVQQYYAHPRNAFWPIMAELLGITWEKDYQARIRQIKACPLVLWDVLQSCWREGSLDSSISSQQCYPNDISALLLQYPAIQFIGFNGTAAEKFFRQAVVHDIAGIERYELVRLPSTSPAYASKNRQQKLAEWRVLETYLN
jgi:TDG/mug DNA glycosylase family protein